MKVGVRNAIAAVSLVATSGACNGPGPAAPADARTREPEFVALEQREWSARPLLLFAPHERDPRERDALLRRARAEVLERGIVTYRVTASSVRAAGAGAGAAEATRLRERFGVSPSDRTAVLVGKDGGEKLRARLPLSTGELFRVIDRMPMRRAELERRR